MTKYLLVVAAAGLAALSSMLLAGCGCTDMGCMDSLTLNLPSAGLDEGVWQFDFASGDSNWSCTFTIPVDPEQPGSCSDPWEAGFEREESDEPYLERAVVGIRIWKAPKVLSVVVRHQDATVLTTDIRPSYEPFEVDNGGGSCNVTCRTASVDLWKAP